MSRPLQNRVHPTGEIVAVRDRGMMMGNRGGRIHSIDRKLAKNWASKQWICCVLDFKNRAREVMGDSYTELFFLDEATALASGHRPCFECRREDALKFSGLWAALRGRAGREKAPEMDKTLHAERRGAFDRCAFTELPYGAIARSNSRILLRSHNGALEWGFSGYGPVEDFKGEVEVITPPTIRSILASGYTPLMHPSAT